MAQVFFLLDPAADLSGFHLTKRDRSPDLTQGASKPELYLSGKFVFLHAASFILIWTMFAIRVMNSLLVGLPLLMLMVLPK